ncbi:hypothetical protein [Tolypothrix sp. VBCCA 56010]|uniref:hypothetical protein n=1 Tax=Tolypothrix sp. VBCCA 56010 TaxID=3137731 RepID=UPI003D7CEB9C
MGIGHRASGIGQGSQCGLGVSRHSPQVGKPAHGGGSPSEASGVALCRETRGSSGTITNYQLPITNAHCPMPIAQCPIPNHFLHF